MFYGWYFFIFIGKIQQKNRAIDGLTHLASSLVFFIFYKKWGDRRDLSTSLTRFRLIRCADPPQLLRKSSKIFCPVFSAPLWSQTTQVAPSLQAPSLLLFIIKGKWGDRRDLNPRRPGPQPGALPTELRPPCKFNLYTKH